MKARNKTTRTIMIDEKPVKFGEEVEIDKENPDHWSHVREGEFELVRVEVHKDLPKKKKLKEAK